MQLTKICIMTEKRKRGRPKVEPTEKMVPLSISVPYRHRAELKKVFQSLAFKTRLKGKV